MLFLASEAGMNRKVEQVSGGNRLLVPRRHDPLNSHTQPCFEAALPVACATLRTFDTKS
jgi:hypothetical protein